MPAHPPDSGLFFSSLDPQQTNPDRAKALKPRYKHVAPGQKDFDRLAEKEAYRLPPATAAETLFRHGGWLGDRKRVRRALVAANCPSRRLERFDECGTDCVIEYSPTLQKHRVRASYCGDRFCVPCSNARAAKYRPGLIERCRDKRVRFVTLTRRGDQENLSACIDHVYRSFTKLRSCRLWRSCVTGGAAVLEITRGKDGSHWHVHLHCLVIGSYIDQRRLSDAWRVASGGSFIVHVREVKDHEAGVYYVSKYLTKGFDRSVVSDPDALIECVCALRGRRVLATFGEWHGADVELDHFDPRDWKRVARFDEVAAASLRRQPWALAVCQSLNIWFEGRGARVVPIASESFPTNST